MKHLAKPEEELRICSMGKTFRVMGVFDNDAEANQYCANHDKAAVIACFGPFIFVANKYAGFRHVLQTA